MVTLAKIAAFFEKVDGRKVSTSSLKRHFRLHVREATEAEEEAAAAGAELAPGWAEDEELQAVIGEMGELARAPVIDPNRVLQLQQKLWIIEARRKLAAGQKVVITSDQAARASQALQKGARDAQEGALLSVLGQAVGLSVRRGFEASGQMVEGQWVEVEDAELVEGDEGGGGATAHPAEEGGDLRAAVSLVEAVGEEGDDD